MGLVSNFGLETFSRKRTRWKCGTRAPSVTDVEQSLDFFRAALQRPGSKVLVTCDYGASRSPALAYLCIADQLGPRRETEAFNLTLEIRPVAAPNGLVVRLGDEILKRDGALLQPLKEFNSRLSAELFNTTTLPPAGDR